MRQLAILTAVAVVAACGQQTNEPATDEVASGPAAPADETNGGDSAPPGENGPAPATDITNGEMRWNFSRSGRGPKLAYGEPATDNVRLTLRCRGSDSVELSFMRPSSAADGGPMTLSADGAERQLEATVEKTELGPVMIRAATGISSEPIQSFRSGSGLEVRWRGETISVPPAGEQGRQLLDSCRA